MSTLVTANHFSIIGFNHVKQIVLMIRIKLALKRIYINLFVLSSHFLVHILIITTQLLFRAFLGFTAYFSFAFLRISNRAKHISHFVKVWILILFVWVCITSLYYFFTIKHLLIFERCFGIVLLQAGNIIFLH